MATRSEATLEANGGPRYELIRRAGPLEILTHLYHDLGIQSNILVCAEYNKDNHLLTPPKVLAALAKVVDDQAALSVIGVSHPSEKKEGKHRLWEARLPHIRIQDCVEFVNTEVDVDLAQVFENAHNQWFNTKDISKPWWKLLVADSRYAIFVYHHFIGDGLSGYAFHRSFLAALNSNEVATSSAPPITKEGRFFFHKPVKMPTSPFDQIDEKLSWLHVIYNFFFWTVLRFFINQKYFLFSNAVFPKEYPTLNKPFSVEEKTRTKIELLRIDGLTMARCLSACRKYNTSFTALLHTLIQVTLAADIYPKAKFGFSRLAVNLRPLLKVNPGPDVLTNAASAYFRKHQLGKYRACAKNAPTKRDPSSTQNVSIDAPPVWKLAKAYKRDLNNAMDNTGSVIQDYLTCETLDRDLEDVSFYGLGLYQNNSFLISNIGVFEPRDNMAEGGWNVNDVAFSAAAVRATLSDAGIVFDVASVNGGDCVISATYEEGVLKDKMVKEVLRLVLARLKLVI